MQEQETLKIIEEVREQIEEAKASFRKIGRELQNIEEKLDRIVSKIA